MLRVCGASADIIQHFSYYASARARVYICSRKRRRQEIFCLSPWHNNPVGIGMQDNFCSLQGKKRPTCAAQRAGDHQHEPLMYKRLYKKAASDNLFVFRSAVLRTALWGISYFLMECDQKCAAGLIIVAPTVRFIYGATH